MAFEFKRSAWGEKIAGPSSIVDLMEDLGQALNNNPDLLFLGGGNPAQIPAVQELLQKHWQQIGADSDAVNKICGVYQSPQGDERLLAQLETLFQKQGLAITQDNLAIVSGSQTALFLLFNLLAGNSSDGQLQKILLPMVPEYLGYADQSLAAMSFITCLPKLEYTGPHRFCYQLDFSALEQITEPLGAVCVSSPTNPSGNLLSNEQLKQLSAWAQTRNLPLIIDRAYGSPFPALEYPPQALFYHDNTVQIWSLSKLGLPGLRTAVVLASPELIRLLVKANTILNLANNNPGPALMERLISSGDLVYMTQELLLNYYRVQRDRLMHLLDEALAGLNYFICEPKGAFFIWLWLPDLPISSFELYEQLKREGLLVMAGEGFFFEWQHSWLHARQCLRLSYCQSDEVLTRAVAILAAQVRTLMHGQLS
ncbi:MAG TPA: valine--pyruvate transaminase [Cellvibrionaceae bacterium]